MEPCCVVSLPIRHFISWFFPFSFFAEIFLLRLAAAARTCSSGVSVFFSFLLFFLSSSGSSVCKSVFFCQYPFIVVSLAFKSPYPPPQTSTPRQTRGFYIYILDEFRIPSSYHYVLESRGFPSFRIVFTLFSHCFHIVMCFVFFVFPVFVRYRTEGGMWVWGGGEGWGGASVQWAGFMLARGFCFDLN